MANFYETMRLKNQLSPTLLRKPGIYGVGVGYADPDKPDRGAAIIVYSHPNVKPAEIRSTMLQKAGVSFPFRLINTDPFKPHSKVQSGSVSRRRAAPRKRVKAEFFRSRLRPVPGGVSIGRITGSLGITGTGGLITIRNGQLYVLSNNHVIVAANRFAANILQPGPLDGGQASDRIGVSVRFVPFRIGGVNFMDAAIAQPITNSLLNPRYLINSGRLITLRGHLLSYRVGASFVKSGRTTGFVSGVVESIGTDQLVGPYREVGNATLLFRNQTVVVGSSPVSQGGDSGSVWITRDGFAAALNFAGSGNRSISTPIASVLSTFGLRVAAPAPGGTFKAGGSKGAAPQGNHAYVRPLPEAVRKQIRPVSTKARK
ncbi:hypothetical protein [Paenibacillus lutrae]|uniref:Serine protease n=1 Tax=Paenibacillus lutrae TaxID=2078573 RepID=A0A7X3FJS9_9BACL|nr:hypothetical protein [Paenibacillus lutrae]MVP01064.1 hypothetical protein [Paenibacillus lutrae]